MIREPEVQGWNISHRSDGVFVALDADANWYVIAPGRDEIHRCPCCNKLFNTARSAKLVANAIYPPAS
jgi:hypothetical protein